MICQYLMIKKILSDYLEVDEELYRYRSKEYYRKQRRLNTHIKLPSGEDLYSDSDSDSYLYSDSDSDSDYDSGGDSYFEGIKEYLINMGEDRYDDCDCIEI